MNASPVRVAILGAGAVGGWIAGRLSLAGHCVQAASSRGLLATVTIEEQGVPAMATLTTFSGPADVLVVAVKAPALSQAARSAGPLIGPRTVILPMMNGVPWWFMPQEPLRSIDPDGRIAAALPGAQVLGAVVHAACSRESGRVVVTHSDRLILGEPGGGHSPRVAELCDLFTAAGIRCEPSSDVRRAIWYKLWGNATINPLSALTRATADRLIAEPRLRRFMLDAMAELAAIGAAAGCPIDESGEERLEVTARLGVFKPSMLQDVEAGRMIELDALLGAPLEIAKQLDLATPTLDLLHAQTRLLGERLGLL